MHDVSSHAARTDTEHDCAAHGEPAVLAADCCGATECDGGAPRLDGEGQPCPTPLHWQQVLQAFREQAVPWEARRGRRAISGRALGEGPPVYFLNGLGGTHELFVLTAWLLRDEFRCVLFDYPGGTRGEGRGTRDERSKSFKTAVIPPALDGFAEDLLAAADHHGDGRFSLYATSFGVAVALAAMLRAPERIERAVLQGGFARLALSPFERGLIRLGRWLPGRLRHVPGRRAIQRQSHRIWFPPFDATRWEFFLENTGSVPLASLARRGAGLLGCDLRPALSGIHAPVLMVRCEGEGRVSAAALEELQAGLPGATQEWMPNCGHLPYLTHPHRLVKLLRPFFHGAPAEG